MPLSTRRASWRRSRDDINKESNEEESAITILKDFCEDTSWGGLGRVAGSNYRVFQVIWMIAFLGGLSAGIYQLVGLFEYWQTKPINTHISLEHSSSLDFPTVTVCNFNILRKSLLNELPNSVRGDIEDLAKKKTPTQKVKKKAAAAEEDDDGYPDPDSADEDYQTAEKIALALMKEDPKELEGIGHQFETMIRGCKFRGVDCAFLNSSQPKTSEWSTFWHYKFGNCFIFNPLAISGAVRRPLKLSKPGPSLGLELEIDVQQAEYIDQITQDAGAVISIAPRGDMPFPYEEGISLSPGTSTSLAMRLVQISRLDRFNNGSCVHSKAGEKRNIYAQRFNASYSTMACIQSCIATEQKSRCKCMEYKYYPNDKIVCDTADLTTVKCLRKVNQLAKNNKLVCSSNCTPPCMQDVYRSVSSFSYWPSDNYADEVAEEMNITTEQIRKNLLKVSIYFQDLNYEKITEERAYQAENFISDIGGQLGLWLGVSVLSGLEVIELVCVLCFHFCCKSDKGPRKMRNKNGGEKEQPTSFMMT